MADRLIELLYENNVRCDIGIESLAEDIRSIFADVQPVKRGRWVTVRVDGDLDIICTRCYERTIMRSDFCPHCGADMRGEDNG